ncbi:hypothetical protein F4779DRAFT_590535 [Xylariaceae sp. FL0662B]|nr:hypothetical protein F4779DRAFT_590535 [Xylariaceae sp. FL0662B]
MPDENTPLVFSTSNSNPDLNSNNALATRRKNMFWIIGCLYGATAVGLGAFGAHGLKKIITDPARLANWATAAHYQLIHSVALLVASRAAPTNVVGSGLLTAGVAMFSGSLYLLVLDPARFRFLGPVTPLGGLCLIGGWTALAFT